MHQLTITLILFLVGATEASTTELDSLLDAQRDRAGEYAAGLFSILKEPDKVGLTPDELDDLRFLTAYLPLGDLAVMTEGDLIENVRLSQEARRRFPWGKGMSESLYRNFVLPHRISQEPFARGWRSSFLEELTPRLDGISMEDAALEVNHWCHEVATFKQTTGRDQDPLTTIRSGYGRCEEEMILTIAALRSVGIPARQCYTPYWPHTDNNHAWVEVWVDGQWYYYGACEPKTSLKDAWFTGSAARAMLVVSTAYGDYSGDEPVLRQFDRSTLLNSTAVYGDTRELEVLLVDENDHPVTDQRVIFSLFNYGAFMPALSLTTDEMGVCRVVCGKGDWIISAGKDEMSAAGHSTIEDKSIQLQLGNQNSFTQMTSVDYNPPPPPPEREKLPADSLFLQRLERENALRERHFWTVWADENNLKLPENPIYEPDSALTYTAAEKWMLEPEALLSRLATSRGNWGTIFKFLFGSYPDIGRPMAFQAGVETEIGEIKGRFLLLETLTDKDLVDFSGEVLEDHYRFTIIEKPLSDPLWVNEILSWDEETLTRFKDNVIAPRIYWEPSNAWRYDLVNFFTDNPRLFKSRDDKRLIEWLRENIFIEENPDRLGPPLSPDQTLALRRGTGRDRAILYVGMCRVRGVPARFNPVSGRLERWQDDDWQEVMISEKSKKTESSGTKGRLFIDAESTDSTMQDVKYLKDWSVQKWETDLFDAVDFGFRKPFSEITWPQELPTGLYCLVTGFRRKDGSAPVKVQWFEIKEDAEVHVELEFRQVIDEEK